MDGRVYDLRDECTRFGCQMEPCLDAPTTAYRNYILTNAKGYV